MSRETLLSFGSSRSTLRERLRRTRLRGSFKTFELLPEFML